MNWWCVNIHVLNARHLHCLTLHIYVVLKVCVCARAYVLTYTHHRLTCIFLKTKKQNPCKLMVQFKFSRSVVSDSLQPHELQHARAPCPSPTPGVCQTRVEKWLKYPASRAQEYWRSELCNWERSWGSLQEMLTYTASLFYSKIKVVKDTTWTEHQLYELFAVWNLLNLSKYTFPYL